MVGEPLCRLVNSQGSDEANYENHSFKVRFGRTAAKNYWLVPKHIADALTNDGRSGFPEHYDDQATIEEIRLLASVLQDQTLRRSILAGITSASLLSLR
jgi:hypothetical protein